METKPTKEEWGKLIKPRLGKWFNYAGNNPQAPKEFVFYDITPIYKTLKKYDKNITNEELENLRQMKIKELQEKGEAYDHLDSIVPVINKDGYFTGMIYAFCLGPYDVYYTTIEKPIRQFLTQEPKIITQGNPDHDFDIQGHIQGDAIFDIRIYNATYAYIYKNMNRDGRTAPYNKAFVTDMEKQEKQGGCVYEKEVDSLLQFVKVDNYFTLRDNTYDNPLFLTLFKIDDMRICTDGDKIQCKSLYMNVYGISNISIGHRGRPFIKFPSENKVCVFGHKHTYICSENDLEYPEGCF